MKVGIGWIKGEFLYILKRTKKQTKWLCGKLTAKEFNRSEKSASTGN